MLQIIPIQDVGFILDFIEALDFGELNFYLITLFAVYFEFFILQGFLKTLKI